MTEHPDMDFAMRFAEAAKSQRAHLGGTPNDTDKLAAGFLWLEGQYRDACRMLAEQRRRIEELERFDVRTLEAKARAALQHVAALPECPRCSECEGEEHHWGEFAGMLDEQGLPLEYQPDEPDIDDPSYHMGYICKHCEAIAGACCSCDALVFPRGPDYCPGCAEMEEKP
jgi:hypothetical protein